MAIKIILDTDIGDDIDDALALGLICGCPELQLMGVTTVHGNVVARARQARTVLATVGEPFKQIPVSAGCSASMASRSPRGPSYDPDASLSQDSTCWPEEKLSPLSKHHGVQFLIDTIMAGNGDIIPITIGAMTNLAAAMLLERRILKKMPRIVCMATEFRHSFAEWNVLCDPEAAHQIFSSGVPVTVTPWTIGHQTQLNDAEISQLARCERSLAKNLSAAIEAWRTAARKNYPDPRPSLFDPMAVATIVEPSLCAWKRGTIKVELAGSDTYGFTTFKEHPDGPHTVAWDANREQSVAFVLNRLTAV